MRRIAMLAAATAVLVLVGWSMLGRLGPGTVAQEVTPAPDRGGHPIIGAWEFVIGEPCWCQFVFTSEGLVFFVEPINTLDAPEGPLNRVSIGVWEPTGDSTAVEVNRFYTEDGAYVERLITWEVVGNGETLAGTTVGQVVRPDGTIDAEFQFTAYAKRHAARSLTLPGGTPVATRAG